MPIAKLTLEVEIAHAHSLKDRRQVVRSIKDTLRHGFNVSVAELDEAVTWNRATLGVASLSRSRSQLEKQLAQAERAARRAAVRFGGEIIDAWAELLSEETSEEGTLTLLQPTPSADSNLDSDSDNVNSPDDFHA